MTAPLLLVDAYSMIYRAFYAIRLLTGPHGQPVNAILGFTKMLRKYLAEQRPTYCAVVFDLGAPHERLQLLPSYKAQRPPTPPDLSAQLPAIREMLGAMRVPVVECDGEEADDLIATLAHQAAAAGQPVLIASNDKDFAQLVNDQIRLLQAGAQGDVILDAAAVQTKYGVRPAQFADLLSLIGDKVDNIPGVPGIGEKTALDLLRQFDNLDALLARIAEVERPKLRESLQTHLEQIQRNRQLVKLRLEVELPVAWNQLPVVRPDYPAWVAVLERHGLRNLASEIAKESRQGDDLFGGF
ncbi:MAG: 5'-3' exonuclease H3TH domain-containing protein [Verrucomicrobiota bacterium]